MSLDIPKITSSIREINLKPLKTTFPNPAIKKVDLKPLKTPFPNPATEKVSFLEAIKAYIKKFGKKS